MKPYSRLLFVALALATSLSVRGQTVDSVPEGVQEGLDSLLLEISPGEELDSLQQHQLDSIRRDKLDRVARDTVSREAVPISDADLEVYAAQRRFQYTEVQRRWTLLDRLGAWINRQIERFFEWLFGKEVAGDYFQVFLKWLPYILLVMLSLLLLRFFMKSSLPFVVNNKRARGVYLSEEEALMEESDLAALQEEARANGDYRLALRYGFLALLRELRDRELIRWQPQKTNQDYLREVREQEIHPWLEEAVRWYEYSWYGGFDLTVTRYNRAIYVLQRILETNGK